MKKPDLDLFAVLPVLSNEEKHQKTLDALSDVDAGRTIPYEAMEVWARSLAKPDHRPKNRE